MNSADNCPFIIIPLVAVAMVLLGFTERLTIRQHHYMHFIVISVKTREREREFPQSPLVKMSAIGFERLKISLKII